MFAEQGPGFAGKRLYLTKTGEEKDPERIKQIRRQHQRGYEQDDKARHLIYFSVGKIRPLVGDNA